MSQQESDWSSRRGCGGPRSRAGVSYDSLSSSGRHCDQSSQPLRPHRQMLGSRSHHRNMLHSASDSDRGTDVTEQGTAGSLHARFNECPQNTDVDDNELDDAFTTTTTAMVLHRVEALAAVLVRALDACQMPEMKQYVDPNKAHGHCEEEKKTLIKRFTLQQCRSFTSILLILAYCHSLLQSTDERGRRRTTTTREVYYFYVTHFRSQRECDAAIWDCCQLLQVPRHAIGLQAGSRGWFCGDIQLIAVADSSVQWDGRAYTGDQGCPVTADWLLPASQRPTVMQSTTATFILVIEKEGIYQRLVQDRFWRDHRCILVTGKGFPDLATRSAVHVMHKQLKLPVLGLADCDPFGVMVLHCYSHGSGDGVDGRGDRYAVPIEWIGLRPSQVQHLSQPTKINNTTYPALPPAVFQELTELDRKRLVDHLLDDNHKFTAAHPRRLNELQEMLESKVELEALYWLGMDFCAIFVGQLLQHHRETLQRRALLEDDDVSIVEGDDASTTDEKLGWMDII